MILLRLFYCDHYHFPLADGHKFPLAKYRLLREALCGDERFQLCPAEPANLEDIYRVHANEFVDAFVAGTLGQQQMRRIGFPWSPELVMRTLASVGGTLGATAEALRGGFGGTLAGGTHHAFRNEGSGFCVFNDLAVSIEWARSQAGVKRVAVMDLDVHQGDGTAAIFENDGEVLTVSLHGERNFPFRKQRSKLDVALPDGTGDETYLQELKTVLPKVRDFQPELLFYQSGVDGLADDRLGRLALTIAGLRSRDELVIGEARRMGVPLVVTLGGGYAEPIMKTVEAHAQTFLVAADLLLN